MDVKIWSYKEGGKTVFTAAAGREMQAKAATPQEALEKLAQAVAKQKLKFAAYLREITEIQTKRLEIKEL